MTAMHKQMPNIVALSCGYADGEVPADRDRTEQIEHRAAQMLGDTERWCELFERAGADINARTAAVQFIEAVEAMEHPHANGWHRDKALNAASRLKGFLCRAAWSAAREELQK